jgi:hypothetical protein
MAPISAPILGSLFKGAFLPQKWDDLPPFSHDTSSFKDTCLLIYLIEAKVALYVLNGQPDMPVLFNNCPPDC